MRRHLPRVGLVLALLIAVGFLWSEVSTGNLDVERTVAQLQAAGPAGWLGYVAAVAAINAVGVSMHPFLVASGTLWPAPLAIVLSWLGILGSSSIDFYIARYLAREWVEKRLSDRFRRYDERLERNGFRTVLMLRLLFFTAHPVSFLAGLSKVSYRDYIVATGLGVIPLTVFVVVLAERIVNGIWG